MQSSNDDHVPVISEEMMSGLFVMQSALVSTGDNHVLEKSR